MHRNLPTSEQQQTSEPCSHFMDKKKQLCQRLYPLTFKPDSYWFGTGVKLGQCKCHTGYSTGLSVGSRAVSYWFRTDVALAENWFKTCAILIRYLTWYWFKTDVKLVKHRGHISSTLDSHKCCTTLVANWLNVGSKPVWYQFNTGVTQVSYVFNTGELMVSKWVHTGLCEWCPKVVE